MTRHWMYLSCHAHASRYALSVYQAVHGHTLGKSDGNSKAFLQSSCDSTHPSVFFSPLHFLRVSDTAVQAVSFYHMISLLKSVIFVPS